MTIPLPRGGFFIRSQGTVRYGGLVGADEKEE
jgi:hypothetical protein